MPSALPDSGMLFYSGPETGQTLSLAEIAELERQRTAQARTNTMPAAPQTGDQLSALAVLRQIEERQASTATGVLPALPPYTGPVTGEMIALPEAAPRSRSGLRRLSRLPASRPLLFILAIQAALSLRLVWSNTAFADEALYLWAGHLEWAHWLHGMPVPDFSAYFSGAPVVYPPLGALADSAGGLAGARALSLVFMLGATVLLYGTAQRLFDRPVAIASALLFATFGAAGQLGAFATYDAMAVFLTALAAWLTVRAHGHLSEPLLICAGLVMALADAAKYAAALWNPVVFALAALTATTGMRGQRLFRAVRVAGYTAIPAAVALHAAGPSYLRGLELTTLDRQLTTPTAPLTVIGIAWGWLALLVLLAILGVWLAWYERNRVWILPLILVGAGLLAPLEQARIEDITSLHKHVVFGAWFLVMVAGYAVARISCLDGKLTQSAVIGAVLIGASAMTGFTQATSFAASWPDMTTALPVIAQGTISAGCPCLIYQEDTAHYYLPPRDFTGGLTGPYFFTYPSVTAQASLTGPDAMAAAIRNGYFGVVEIDASRGSQNYRQITGALAASRQYVLRSSVPWALHPGEPTQVWVRAAGAAR